MGSTEYSHLVDVWSGGCVMGEMIKGKVLFKGQVLGSEEVLLETKIFLIVCSRSSRMKLVSSKFTKTWLRLNFLKNSL